MILIGQRNFLSAINFFLKILTFKANPLHLAYLFRVGRSFVTSLRARLTFEIATKLVSKRPGWPALEMKNSRKAMNWSNGGGISSWSILSKLKTPKAFRMTRRHADCNDKGVSKEIKVEKKCTKKWDYKQRFCHFFGFTLNEFSNFRSPKKKENLVRLA